MADPAKKKSKRGAGRRTNLTPPKQKQGREKAKAAETQSQAPLRGVTGTDGGTSDGVRGQCNTSATANSERTAAALAADAARTDAFLKVKENEQRA